MARPSIILYSILFLSCLGSNAQDRADYKKADQLALQFNSPITTLRALDSLLTIAESRLGWPEEKVRFVFRWIAENLEYDCSKGLETNSSALSLEIVIKNKKSTCSGYASLMNYALKKMGFESKAIRGVAKTARQDLNWQTLPRENHSWNAVKLAGEWKLLDATWASGEASDNCDTVIRSFADFYFFPEPEMLMLSHFPADSNWQLVEKPIDSARFLSLPIFHDPYYEKHVRTFYPEDGNLRVKKNEYIRFRFEASTPIEQIAVWSEEKKTILPEFGRMIRNGNQYEYNYRVKESGDYYLNVSLDGKRTALVYRVNSNPE